MRARQITILALVVGAVVAACELNPQPLPPGPDSEFTPTGGATGEEDGGAFNGEDAGSVPAVAEDASVDGGVVADGGDAGDAGDGGDAGADAEVSE